MTINQFGTKSQTHYTSSRSTPTTKTTITGTKTRPTTAAQPMPTQIGPIYNIVAVININQETPSIYKDILAIILDSGAPLSVCPHSRFNDGYDGGSRETICQRDWRRPQHQRLRGDDNGHRQDHHASEVLWPMCIHH
eukprot:2200204-Amphidinium_carterae.6